MGSVVNWGRTATSANWLHRHSTPVWSDANGWVLPSSWQIETICSQQLFELISSMRIAQLTPAE